MLAALSAVAYSPTAHRHEALVANDATNVAFVIVGQIRSLAHPAGASKVKIMIDALAGHPSSNVASHVFAYISQVGECSGPSCAEQLQNVRDTLSPVAIGLHDGFLTADGKEHAHTSPMCKTPFVTWRAGQQASDFQLCPADYPAEYAFGNGDNYFSQWSKIEMARVQPLLLTSLLPLATSRIPYLPDCPLLLDSSSPATD